MLHSALSSLWQLPRHTHCPHTPSDHMHLHIHIAQIAVQVFNDVCMLAAVEDGQGPCITLVSHVGICWIDGDSSQVYHKVASKDGAHALAQQVKDSLHILPAGSPTPASCDERAALHLHVTPSERLLACATSKTQHRHAPDGRGEGMSCHRAHKPALPATAEGPWPQAPGMAQALAGLTSKSDLVSYSKW